MLEAGAGLRGSVVWLCLGRGGYVTGVWCARVHEMSARVCGRCQGVCGICTHVAEVDICCVSERAFTVGVVPTHVLGGIVDMVSAHVCGRG